ncbi:hypothetical protein M9Y10_045826 [Tritrichomonas musculus]|uniref:Uncharacterized protein n=1 Tax=Tritrichomonas musculus TaxID=1915356 RepID=A0ABR2JXJ7_9EUKA
MIVSYGYHVLPTSNLDASSISSFSSFEDHSVAITSSGELLSIGRNSDGRISQSVPSKTLQDFIKYEIEDSQNHKCTPISAVCCNKCTIYLVSIQGDNKNHLFYASNKIKSNHPVILNIGNNNPIAIYGGYVNAAAISEEGSIIFIPQLIDNSSTINLEATSLPGEKKQSALHAVIIIFLL